MADDQNPLVQALPPASDCLTYLTIIEYNLTEENLPILHKVLQDEKLTTNIGWDLIHLLIPMLPASRDCLNDIARLGNPREVILKTTETLRLLDLSPVQREPDPDKEGPSASSSVPAGGDPSQPEGQGVPLAVQQFVCLLQMLSILHTRIKTKYPSRFLSTSLQALLASYSEAETHVDDLTAAVAKFVKAISGTRRPQLPPRISSNRIPTQGNFVGSQALADDPEAQKDAPSQEEKELQKKLLQAFLTHVIEEYILSLHSDDDVPGLAWSSRVQERLNPRMLIPGKPTMTSALSNEGKYHSRSTTLGELVALAQDLGIHSQELYNTITEAERPAVVETTDAEEEPPSSVTEIGLSKNGALFLLTARASAEYLYDTPDSFAIPPLFPEHAQIVQNFIGLEEHGGMPSIGTEPEAIIDAVLALALIAIAGEELGDLTDDDSLYTKYLQITSLVSANTPSPTLRYQAHFITSTVLRSNPVDVERLSFIHDTLEHCPYENLKASAVSWLKGEIVEANLPKPFTHQTSGVLGLGLTAVPEEETEEPISENGSSIFSTPIALSTVSSVLFPDLTEELHMTHLTDGWTYFKANFSFFLATLNFYYLLLFNEQLRSRLDIAALHSNNDIGGSYIYPMRNSIERFKKALGEGGELVEDEGEAGVQAGLVDLRLMEDALDRVGRGVAKLNDAN